MLPSVIATLQLFFFLSPPSLSPHLHPPPLPPFDKGLHWKNKMTCVGASRLVWQGPGRYVGEYSEIRLNSESPQPELEPCAYQYPQSSEEWLSERKALAWRIVDARVKLSEWHEVAELCGTVDFEHKPPSCSVSREQALPSLVPGAFLPSESQVDTCSWWLELSEADCPHVVMNTTRENE